MLKILPFVILLTLSFGVSPGYTSEDPVAQSRAVVKQFGGQLKTELLATLKEGGPVNAIPVCSQKAPAIAAGLSQDTGWDISRTSLKARNPKNNPDPWEQTILESFQQRRASGEDPQKMEHHEVLTMEGKRFFRYMKAIPVGQPCLTCHGEQIDPGLKAKLTEFYPEDRATGYSPGEIIGAFSIIRDM